MKVYYFISSLEKDDYIFFRDKIEQIYTSNDALKVIKKYVHKIGGDSRDTTQKAELIEACVFINEYLTKHQGDIGDIEWVYRKNFLSYNTKVYVFQNDNWEEILDQTLFISSRDTFKHPFFYYLSHGAFDSHIRILRPNLFQEWDTLDKLFLMKKLWDKRDMYIGDVIIPFFMKKDEAIILKTLKFIKEKLGNHCIVKNNFGVEGFGVKAIDISNSLTQRHINTLKNNFFSSKNIYNRKSCFFIPFYDIKREYRIYYTHFNSQIKFFSVKHKSYDTSDPQRLFALGDISRHSIGVNWECGDMSMFDSDHSLIRTFSEDIVKKLGLETGVLEICECRDGTYKFIEVNPLGGTLMFQGIDEERITSYYTNLWENLLKTKSDISNNT